MIGLAFADLLGGARVPLARDLLVFFIPFKALLGQSFANLELPLWNPWILLGTPFLASMQAAVLYPPSLLLALPFPAGFDVFLLFHYFAAASGAFVLLRSRALSLTASSIGTLAFTLGGLLVSLLNLTNHLQATVWVPMALFFWARHSDCPGQRRWRAGLLATVCLQLLAGSPETVLLTFTLLGAWTLFRNWSSPAHCARLVGELGITGGLAGGLAAAQILPTLELLQHSVRNATFSLSQVTFWSLEPVSLLQLLLPHSTAMVGPAEQNSIGVVFETQVPWLWSIYVGLPVLCLAIVGLARGRERAFWAATLAVGLVLALGKFTPVFPALYDLFPFVFGRFRFPEKFFLLVHLAIFVLSAEGTERLVAGDGAARRLAVVAAGTLMAVAGALLLLRWLDPLAFLQLLSVIRGVSAPLASFVIPGSDVVFKSQRLLLVLGGFVALVLLHRRLLIRPAVFAVLLVVLTAADLGGAHYNLNLSVPWPELHAQTPRVNVERLRARRLRVFNYQTESSARRTMDPKPIPGLEEAMRTIRNTDDVIRYAFGEWPNLPGNTGILYRVAALTGADSIDRSDIEFLREILAVVPREHAVKLLRLFSVGSLVGRSELDALPSIELVGREGDSLIYDIVDPIPRAYLVNRLRPGGEGLETANLLISPDFEPGEEAVVETIPKSWRDAAPRTPAGTATIVTYGNDQLTIETNAQTPSWLVVNDSFYPGWQARIDGRVVPIVRTNALVRGIAVPAGHNLVDLRYRPMSFRIGVFLSLFSALVALAWILRRRGSVQFPPR